MSGNKQDAWLGPPPKSREVGWAGGAELSIDQVSDDRQNIVVLTKHCGVGNVTGGQLPRTWGLLQLLAWWDIEAYPGLRVSSPFLDRTRSQGQDRSRSLDYVTSGMWNSFVSKIRGLLGGLGSLLALWSSLKSPVPMFMGIPMMMHSDTPHTESFWPK